MTFSRYCSSYSAFLSNGITFRSYATKRTTSKDKGSKKDFRNVGNKVSKDAKKTKLEPKDLDEIALKSNPIKSNISTNFTTDKVNEKRISFQSNIGKGEGKEEENEDQKKKDIPQEWRRGKNQSGIRENIFNKPTLAKNSQFFDTLEETVNTELKSEPQMEMKTEKNVDTTMETEFKNGLLDTTTTGTDTDTELKDVNYLEPGKINSTAEYISFLPFLYVSILNLI